MKENNTKHPSSGGSWKRNADGSLKNTEPSTVPSPGKTAIRKAAAEAAQADEAAEAARKRTSNAATKTQENGNV